MSTIRIARRKRYAQIERDTIEDSRLSFRARGILAWLLAKPDDWTCDGRAVANASEVEGRDACYAALKELSTLGYLVRTRYRDQATGQWRTDSVVHECPVAPDPGFQDGVKGGNAALGMTAPNPANQDPGSQDPGDPDSADQEPITKNEDQQLTEIPRPPSSSEAPKPDPTRPVELDSETRQRGATAARAAKERLRGGKQRPIADVIPLESRDQKASAL